MPDCLHNFGLEIFLEDDEFFKNLMICLTHEGKGIEGYSGCSNLFNPVGHMDIFLKTTVGENNTLEVVGMDTHCCGLNIWNMRNTGINLTPENAHPMNRVFMFRDPYENPPMLPVHLINADVLPSFLEHDQVLMQTCALPSEITYYADMDEYTQSHPGSEGMGLLPDTGAILAPIGFLMNHDTRVQTDDISIEDDQVLFFGVVKKALCGTFEFGELEIRSFIRCIVDTPYGELPIVHSIEGIPEEERKNIHEGAVVSGMCIISGDVAVDKYEHGYVVDEENNFRLLRQVMIHGEAERLRPVLAENAVYVSEANKKRYVGPDEIINRLNFVHEAQRADFYAYPAIITSNEGKEYPFETQCLIIAYHTSDQYNALVFLDMDEEGMITRILVTEDSEYSFHILSEEGYKTQTQGENTEEGFSTGGINIAQ